MCVSNLRDSPAFRVAKREARGWKTLFENNSVQLRFHTRVQAGPTPALFAPISLKTHLGGPADWLIRQLTVRRRRDQRPGNHAVVAALFVTSYFLAHSPLISWTYLLIFTVGGGVVFASFTFISSRVLVRLIDDTLTSGGPVQWSLVD